MDPLSDCTHHVISVEEQCHDSDKHLRSHCQDTAAVLNAAWLPSSKAMEVWVVIMCLGTAVSRTYV